MRAWAAAAVAGGLLLVYLLTLPPSLTWAHHGADGGDLVAAVAKGSTPHPPGFPTYLLVGELFIRLPWGEPARRLNLLSAALAAGAAGLTVLSVWFLLRQSSHHAPPVAICCAALASGLGLGLAPLFWSQALIAEVYAPAAFFAALLAYLALRDAPAWALGLTWGVGMGVHPVLSFLAPLVAAAVWREAQGRLRRLAEAGLATLLAWGALYGPVLLLRDGSSPWGDVRTPAGWWALVSGRLYHGYLLALPLAAWPQRLLAWAALLARQFTPVGAVLAGVGFLCLWQQRRALAWASILTLIVFSFYAITYDTADSLVYLVPALPSAAAWLGLGVARAACWLGQRLRYVALAILVLPVIQALLFWGQMDLSGDRTAVEWAERVLEGTPSRAVLLTAQDAHTFTLWYAQDALGQRPDVVVLDRDLWGQVSYRQYMGNLLGIETIDASLSAEDAARRAGRPVVQVSDTFAEEP